MKAAKLAPGRALDRRADVGVAAPPLLTVAEVGAILRKRPAAVRALARRGELAFIRSGRAMLFRPEDLAAYLERCRRPASWERGAAALADVLR